MAGLKLIIPPAVEPVKLEDVKPQLRIDLDDTDYDDILDPLIIAAREWCEGYQNRAFITQTLEIALDEWPCKPYIELPRPPLQSVLSFKYTDSDGNETTWVGSNYSVDDYSFLSKVVKNKYVSWPTVCLAAVNGIKIRYVAGYPPNEADPPDLAANVPEKIKQAITLLTMHWYENGMCDPPPAVLSLLRMDRVMPV